MTESPNNKRFEKKTPKKLAIHLHAFQDVRVFAAALDADADPPVILFNARLEKDLREKTVEKNEQLPKHGFVIVQSLLVSGVVCNITTLKVVVEEFAHGLQALHPAISDLFLEDSAHDVSSEIRRHLGAFPHECGHGAKLRQTIEPNTTW